MTLTIEIKPVESLAEWAAVISLRYEVLRKDWDQPFHSACDASDQTSSSQTLAHFHPENGEAICTARFQPYNLEKWAQVRYVAVQKSMQSKGYGMLVMEAIHIHAKAAGYTHIYLEARDTALPLYRKLGYTVIGFHDLRLGLIPHYSCEIEL